MHKIMVVTFGLMFAFKGAAIADEAQDSFFQNLQATCGHSYVGSVVEGNESDTAWRQARIVIHVPSCDQALGDEIRIPLHVGDDTSRTWIISRTKNGLQLKHDHRHEDGTADAVSMYGGHTTDSGSSTQQTFPVDAFSKALFTENGLDVSVHNTWTLTVTPGDQLSYQLSRPGRLFKVAFNLRQPLH